MLPQAEDLLERAQKGERLSSSERRHVISYCMVKRPEFTNVALAELFKVSERMIRLDKKKIRTDRAKIIKEDDVGLVIADIALSFENQVADIEKSKTKCRVGSRDYLEHCKAIFNLQMQKVKSLQDLGYFPRNLGSMSVEKFEYVAIVSQDGTVQTRPVNLQVARSQEDNVIDVEFEDQKALPAPESTDDQRDEDPT